MVTLVRDSAILAGTALQEGSARRLDPAVASGCCLAARAVVQTLQSCYSVRTSICLLSLIGEGLLVGYRVKTSGAMLGLLPALLLFLWKYLNLVHMFYAEAT